MNKNQEETVSLVSEIVSNLEQTDAEVMVAPTFVNLASAVNALNSSDVEVVAQNMHFAALETGTTSAFSSSMRLTLGAWRRMSSSPM